MLQKRNKPVARPRLSDLNGLRVSIMLPPGAETHLIVSHLARIGCVSIPSWPIPSQVPLQADVAFITLDLEYRDGVQRLVANLDEHGPPLIALAEYEDPSTLQLLLEMRAAAVIERPIKPFGLLTNLMIARDIWWRRIDSASRVKQAEDRNIATTKAFIAKILVAEACGMPPAEAHKKLQKMAMDSRMSIESVAEQIIAAGASPELVNALNHLNKTELGKSRQ